MSKKGFTLVELLAAVVVLAIIISVAVPATVGIMKYIDETQRDNVIRRIEAAASNYAGDTKKTLVFVEDLIKEGYLDGDENGNIIDPVNNHKMNCFVVEMTKNGDYYDAKFVERKNYDDSGKCDSKDLQKYNDGVSIEIAGATTSESTTWIRGTNVVLKATSLRFSIDCDKNICEWTSKSGARSNGKEIKINNTGVLVTTYSFRYTLTNSTDKTGYYSDSVEIKLDNQAPTIKNSTGAINKYQKEKTKTIKIEATDGTNGSGISKGYYLGINNGQSCDSIPSNEYKEANHTTGYRDVVTSNGSYLVCVKDNVGNTSSLVININTII